MNVLLVSLFPLERNTSVAISNINITQGLLELGHRVTWVMPNWKESETLFNESQVRVIRIPGHDQNRDAGYILNKIRSHFRFLDFTRPYLHQYRNIKIPHEFFDVVISTSDPKTSHVFTSRLLRRVKYGRWIQHWGDPLLGDITRNFWWPKWFVKAYEWGIIRKADKIIYVTPFTCNIQRKEHPRLAYKIFFAPLPTDMNTTITKPLENSLRIAYLGDFNPTFRNLQPLYDACSMMENVSLTIAGHGPKFPCKQNITVLPRISQKQALEIEDAADVIFCACNKCGTQIPGKIYYRASSDKHILIALEKEWHNEFLQYFTSFNRFIVCDNTRESIIDALQSLSFKPHKYITPSRLLPNNVAKEILQ